MLHSDRLAQLAQYLVMMGELCLVLRLNDDKKILVETITTKTYIINREKDCNGIGFYHSQLFTFLDLLVIIITRLGAFSSLLS